MSHSKHLQIVSGAPNVVFSSPNKFVYRLPFPYKSGSYDRVSMKSVRLYYSWFNVTGSKNNNQISYMWHDGSTHTILFNDGIWSFEDFNAYLQQVMQSKNHYLLDENSRPYYFISLVANAVFYRISLTVQAVPAVLPVDWTAPPGWVAPAADTTPQLIVPSTAVATYLGFDPGTYPAAPQSTVFQKNSQHAPQVTASSSLMLLCNLVMNDYGPDSRTLASFNVPPGTDPGSLLSEVPFYQDWIPVQPGSSFNQITIELVDQNANPVKIEDPAGFICTLNLDTLGQ